MVPPLLPNLELSRYCVTQDVEDGTLYYHLATGELVHLDAPFEEQPLIDKAQMILKEFVEPKTFRYELFIEGIRNQQRKRYMSNADALTYTIMTTLDCNCNCFYCFEDRTAKTKMTAETAKDVAHYIIEHSKGKKVRLSWYGGEPLYNKDVIDIIINEIKDKVKYTSNLTSNALLLDDETIKKAKELWHLKNVQVTLDGTEEVYNRIKDCHIYKDGAFKQVISNIDKLLEAKINVCIRLNTDNHNFEDIKELCTFLIKKYKDEPALTIYTHLLMNNGDEYAERHKCLAEINHMLIDADKYSRRDLSSFRLVSLSCMADNPNIQLIDPNGNIGICENYCNDILVGSIYYDGKDNTRIENMQQRYRNEKCSNCPILPLCYKLDKCPTLEACTDEYIENRKAEIRKYMIKAYTQYKNCTPENTQTTTNISTKKG